MINTNDESAITDNNEELGSFVEKNSEGEKVPIIRTIAGAARFLKEKDPDCPITEYIIRKAVSNGLIPTRTLNKRKYVEINKVLDYFSNVKQEVPAVEEEAVAIQDEETDRYRSLWES